MNDPSNDHAECAASRVLRNDSNNLLLIFSYLEGWDWEFYRRHAEARTINSVDRKFTLPANFRPLNFTDEKFLSKTQLALNNREFYLPLHIALAEGEDKIARQMIERYPSIVTTNAVQCAVNFNQYSMVKYMLPLLDDMSDIRRINRQGKCEFPGDHPHFDCGDFCAESNEDIRHKITYTIHSPEEAKVQFIASECPERDMFEYYDYDTLTPVWSDNPDDYAHYSLNAFEYFISIVPETGFSKCIRGVCESGRLDLAQALVPKLSFEDIGSAAAKAGQRCIIQWIYDAYPGLGFLSMWSNLVSCGHYTILQPYVIQDGWTIERLQKLYKETTRPDHTSHGKICAVDSAIDLRDVRVVQLLHSMGFPLDKIHPLSLEVVMYLHEHRAAIKFSAFDNAVEILRKFYKNTPIMMPDAAVVGYFYDLHPNTQFSWQILDVAVLAGSLEMVKVLLEHCKVQLSEKSLEWSIRRGHFNVAEYLCVDAGVKFSTTTINLCWTSSDTRFLELWARQFPQDVTSYMKERREFESLSAECFEYILSHPLFATPELFFRIRYIALRFLANNGFDHFINYFDKMESLHKSQFLLEIIAYLTSFVYPQYVTTIWHMGCKIWDAKSLEIARQCMSKHPSAIYITEPSPLEPYYHGIKRTLERSSIQL